MLRPMAMEPVPPETARVARAAFPKGHRDLRLADDLDTLCRDEPLVTRFPPHGQPARPPWRLGLVTLLQCAEGLSDRQAVNAVQSRIDGTYILRLELTDPGVEASVLSECRPRLLAGAAASLLFAMWLTGCRDRQLLKARGRQRPDSTPILAAGRALNRIEVVGEPLRHTLNTLAVVAPEWLRAVSPPAWRDRYPRRAEDARVPTTQTARAALTRPLGNDGRRWLAAVDHPDAPDHAHRHHPRPDRRRGDDPPDPRRPAAAGPAARHPSRGHRRPGRRPLRPESG
jgi:transposase